MPKLRYQAFSRQFNASFTPTTCGDDPLQSFVSRRWSNYALSRFVFGDKEKNTRTGMKSDNKIGIGPLYEDLIREGIDMDNLTKKEIKKLVKAAKENMAYSIEQEAIKQTENGYSVDINLEIQMGGGDPPSKSLGAVTQCFWFCYTINGVRYCTQFCF